MFKQVAASQMWCFLMPFYAVLRSKHSLIEIAMSAYDRQDYSQFFGRNSPCFWSLGE